MKMGKDDAPDNHPEISQPLLTEDKSDYAVCSTQSSSSNCPSPLSEISSQASLSSSSSRAIVPNLRPQARSSAPDQPSCSTASSALSSSCLLSTSGPKGTTNSSETSPKTGDKLGAPNSVNSAIDLGNQRCAIDSPTLDNETGDSQQTLFAPEAHKLNFYKRWFFSKHRQPEASAGVDGASGPGTAVPVRTSGAVSVVDSPNGSSSSASERKRKMINLSQYNKYIQNERELKKRHDASCCAKRASTATASNSATGGPNTLPQSNSSSTSASNTQTTDDLMASDLVAGPSGLRCGGSSSPSSSTSSSSSSTSSSSAPASSDAACASASTSLSRGSSNSGHFSFDSDDEITTFSANQPATSGRKSHHHHHQHHHHQHHHHQHQQSHSNNSNHHHHHSHHNNHHHHQRRRQSSCNLDNGDLSNGVQRPLMSHSRSASNQCSITVNQSALPAENQQVLSAQALCCAPDTTRADSPKRSYSPSTVPQEKSILWKHMEEMERKRRQEAIKMQLKEPKQRPILPSSVSQVSVASSMLTDPLQPICKICHLNAKDGDPLISPCKCAGTMQFIHCGCLMRWLEISSKKTRKPLSCELCQYQYHWHKKFKVDHLQFPYCSRKDRVLHLLFLFSLCIMITCAVTTVLCFKRDRLNALNGHSRTELSESELSTLICGVLFFLSFFTAMYVQVKARNTLYRLIVKFIYLNQQWYIDEYEKKDTSSSPVEV